MRFRPQQPTIDDDQPVDARPREEERIQDWQRECLTRLGYGSVPAAMLVADAWANGEHADLVHRIEGLIGRGATLEQAARIVVPAVELDTPAA